MKRYQAYPYGVPTLPPHSPWVRLLGGDTPPAEFSEYVYGWLPIPLQWVQWWGSWFLDYLTLQVWHGVPYVVHFTWVEEYGTDWWRWLFTFWIVPCIVFLGLFLGTGPNRLYAGLIGVGLTQKYDGPIFRGTLNRFFFIFPFLLLVVYIAYCSKGLWLFSYITTFRLVTFAICGCVALVCVASVAWKVFLSSGWPSNKSIFRPSVIYGRISVERKGRGWNRHYGNVSVKGLETPLGKVRWFFIRFFPNFFVERWLKFSVIGRKVVFWLTWLRYREYRIQLMLLLPITFYTGLVVSLYFAGYLTHLSVVLDWRWSGGLSWHVVPTDLVGYIWNKCIAPLWRFCNPFSYTVDALRYWWWIWNDVTIFRDLAAFWGGDLLNGYSGFGRRRRRTFRQLWWIPLMFDWWYYRGYSVPGLFGGWFTFRKRWWFRFHPIYMDGFYDSSIGKLHPSTATFGQFSPGRVTGLFLTFLLFFQMRVLKDAHQDWWVVYMQFYTGKASWNRRTWRRKSDKLRLVVMLSVIFLVVHGFLVYQSVFPYVWVGLVSVVK